MLHWLYVQGFRAIFEVLLCVHSSCHAMRQPLIVMWLLLCVCVKKGGCVRMRCGAKARLLSRSHKNHV
jgi:hypothetical protein